MQLPPFLFPLLLFAGIVAGVTLLLVFSSRHERRRIEKIYGPMRESIGGRIEGKELRGRFLDRPFVVAYYSGGRNSSPSCSISLEARFPGRLSIRAETQSDVSAKRKEFSVEVQTGDPGFDEKCYVEADDPEFARLYLEGEGKRTAIASLLEDIPDASEIRVEKGGVRLHIQPFSAERFESRDMPSIIGRLGTLAAPGSEAGLSAGGSRARNAFKPLLALTIVLFVAGDVGTILGLTKYPPLDGGIIAYSLLFSAPAFILYVLLSRRLLKGSSSAHRNFGYIVALSLFAFLPISVAIASHVNGDFQGAPPERHTLTVTEKRTVQGKSGTVFQLVHAPLAKPGTEDFLPVAREEYERARIGDAIVYTINTGRLGYKWLAGQELIPSKR